MRSFANPCTVCAARRGEGCITRGGSPLDKVHPERLVVEAGDWAAKYDQLYRQPPNGVRFGSWKAKIERKAA